MAMGHHNTIGCAWGVVGIARPGHPRGRTPFEPRPTPSSTVTRPLPPLSDPCAPTVATVPSASARERYAWSSTAAHWGCSFDYWHHAARWPGLWCPHAVAIRRDRRCSGTLRPSVQPLASSVLRLLTRPVGSSAADPGAASPRRSGLDFVMWRFGSIREPCLAVMGAPCTTDFGVACVQAVLLCVDGGSDESVLIHSFGSRALPVCWPWRPGVLDWC